jgi:hypothetical protein
VAVVMAVLDDRLIRGANLWLKPIKFMLSTAVFALTTAWLMGLLAPAQRHAPVTPLPVAAQAVVVGLVLSGLLGTVSGFLLGGQQPPLYGEGALPLLGWHLTGGDGRPAHFLGLHAHQLLPLFGFCLQRYASPVIATSALWTGIMAYMGMWWGLMWLALG